MDTDDENNSNDERLVSCSFCNEKLSSAEIGRHLMLCGNKTDSCPNCQKYIRRAVFAYHYENNCADLKGTENDIDEKTNQSYPSSLSSAQNDNARKEHDVVLPCEICEQSIPYSSYEKHVKNYHEQGEEQMESQSGTDEGQDTNMNYQCRYCNQNCFLWGIQLHELTCNENPYTGTIAKNVKRVWCMLNPSSYS